MISYLYLYSVIHLVFWLSEKIKILRLLWYIEQSKRVLQQTFKVLAISSLLQVLSQLFRKQPFSQLFLQICKIFKYWFFCNLAFVLGVHSLYRGLLFEYSSTKPVSSCQNSLITRTESVLISQIGLFLTNQPKRIIQIRFSLAQRKLKILKWII